MRRTLLVAALIAALAAPQQPAGACDITKLKAQLTECAEYWYDSFLADGYCNLGVLGLCYLFD
ncbi:MAG: hypothetical protein HOQ11_07085 [Gemmatimonadaceae bacterium]|nr:hypothetical protein [Gemmatimonadaceae bacterium]NUQ92989.1 hypothetical protein [Gemmatimonadaceae bacterium]NUR19037.1 hypothetical protein [Gemmatimonadaceae bacterium]NUS97155.1 hypothetical protein [Gemmatimonadaceae bacterium]